MSTIKKIRKIIFWLTLIFILSAIFALTIGQYIPIEFQNANTHSKFYYILFTFLPLSILLTLIGTINRHNSKTKNWIIVIITGLSSGICFILLINIMFTLGFGFWVNQTTLYIQKSDKNITINEQIFDNGAFGYGKTRIVKIEPFLNYFQIVKTIDTTDIDKTRWNFINKEGEIKYP